jgi:dihydroorotate dehydrogenase
MAASGSAASVLARAALPILQRLPPETAHGLALRALRLSRHHWPTRQTAFDLEVETLNQRFSHPVGLAAGFDKNGEYLDALGALGFSHIEVGTVTPRPQPGNPRPRLFRVRAQRALINRMGFNNKGAEHAARAMRRATYRGIRGVSIGKNADTPLPSAIDDYRECLNLFYDVADYFAINVSSPNTARLRELQTAEALGGILDALQEERLRLEARHGRRVPVLVKIAPDLDSDEFGALCKALLRSPSDGVIATNTSIDVPELRAELERRGGGGVSGAPLAARSLATLGALRQELGDEIPIISVGGIMSATDAVARLRAGATLVQLYTGFVYRGPSLLQEILDALEG